MHPTASVPVTSVRGIGPLPELLDRMAGLGATADVFSEVGLPLELTHETERMIRLSDLIALYETAAGVSGDPLFGLKAGREMVHGYGTWVDYARKAPTLRSCLERASRSIAYHQTGTTLTLSIEGDEVRYAYGVSSGRPRDRFQHIQHTLPALLATFRIYTGPDWTPSRIELDVARDARTEALERALSIPIRCGQPAMAVVFSPELLYRPQHADTDGSRSVGWGELRSMVRRGPPRQFVELVREMIHLDLLAGATDVDGVAYRLGIGPRTLQRRLKDMSFSYRDLVSAVRLERGMTLLETTNLPVTEIAFSLGYSDSSHFARAFRQKLGVPPSVFRSARRAAAPPSTAHPN